MQVTETIHAMRIPFTLKIGPGRTVDRFVFLYLIYGEKICLVDCGVACSRNLIFDPVRRMGREPEEIALCVLTHAHPDHMGGALGVRKAVDCKIAAHVDEVAWVEDVDLQFEERPVPSFHDLVEGSVKVDLHLQDGNRVDLGGGDFLTVFHTPGHSRGHIALFHERENALFAGDCIPLPGTMPIYEDVTASVKSLEKLKGIRDLAVLCSAWDEPRRGGEAYQALDESLRFIRRVHQLVLDAKSKCGSGELKEIGLRVKNGLGLPDFAMNPLFLRSIEAHLEAVDSV